LSQIKKALPLLLKLALFSISNISNRNLSN
jgi:hypothetical protein